MIEIIEHASLAEALLHAQSEYPPLDKGTKVTVTMKDNKGKYSYNYADLAYTKHMTDPYLWKHGLVVSGKTEFRDGKEFQVDTLRHVPSNEFDVSEVEITEGGDMKQFGGNSTFAKRYNYCNLTGRVGEDDSEPRDVERENKPSGSTGAGNKPDDDEKLKKIKDRVGMAEKYARAQGITEDDMDKLADELIGEGKVGIELYNALKAYGIALKALSEKDDSTNPENLEDDARSKEES